MAGWRLGGALGWPYQKVLALKSVRSGSIEIRLPMKFLLRKLLLVRKAKPAPEESPTVEQFIGQRIRTLRLQRTVTLDQLADRVRLTKGQLSKIENGLVSSPVSSVSVAMFSSFVSF